ncbi:MAG: DUF418 domain-containing protein [Bacteroidales bacterium]|nr:DUF418 domain-containing protein [Bacteroidales bacterium]MDD2322892.1 DUF418 domain-containing protein [Bacteroidales bacterium]MDD3010088.1 DUF418 domain-containing protein [Bacteroidales bacterium]MDD3960648.1 DUF418 domain-containing protein [Bacteroidales bacterium]MDY0286360.1 DUF418 domain-containing protein [Bacteroidales bacterium]
MKTTFTPTAPATRDITTDILRGFALLGVLLVNAFGYNASFFDFNGFYSQFTDPVNAKVFTLVVGYAADKFIFIFSFLFGIGFSILYQKYGHDEAHFIRFYLKRLGILFCFGLLHISLLWAGDILLSYSLLGIVLLLLRKTKTVPLFLLSLFLYFLPILYIALESRVPGLPSALSSTGDIAIDQVIATYSKGTWTEIIALRLHEYAVFRNINLIYYGPKILSLFLLGHLGHRLHFLSAIQARKLYYLLIFALSFTCGIFLTAKMEAVIDWMADAETNPLYTAIYMGVFELANIFLATGYIIAVVILAGTRPGKRILSPLKYVGRMALTNYLMQSVIFMTLMLSWGFGLFGRVEPRHLLWIVAAVFAFQIMASKIWLHYYRFGPLEWIWRKLTYGRIK